MIACMPLTSIAVLTFLGAADASSFLRSSARKRERPLKRLSVLLAVAVAAASEGIGLLAMVVDGDLAELRNAGECSMVAYSDGGEHQREERPSGSCEGNPRLRHIEGCL